MLQLWTRNNIIWLHGYVVTQLCVIALVGGV